MKQLALPFKLGVGGPLAGGSQYMPWIHRDDEIGLILWVLDNSRASGVYNATAPNPVTNRVFSAALGKVLKRPSFMPAPKLAIRALRGPELTEQIVASIRVVPRRALDHGYVFRHPEIEPALKDLLAERRPQLSHQGSESSVKTRARPSRSSYPVMRLRVVSPTASIE